MWREILSFSSTGKHFLSLLFVFIDADILTIMKWLGRRFLLLAMLPIF